jgi:hypothetical protein
MTSAERAARAARRAKREVERDGNKRSEVGSQGSEVRFFWGSGFPAAI